MKRKTIFYFINIFLYIPFVIVAQDTNYVRNVIRTLSSPEMHGRWIANQGDSIAANFIRNEMITHGIPPIGTDYYQSFGVLGYAMEKAPFLAIDNQTLTLYEDYRIPFSTPNMEGDFPIIQGDLALLDYDRDNFHTPDPLWKKYQKKYGKKLTNAFICFDLRNLSKLDKEKYARITHNLEALQWQETHRYKVKGFLLLTENMPTFGVGYIGKPLFSVIYVDAKSINQTPKQIQLQFSNEIKQHLTQNVCGWVRGTSEPDSFLVFTAHYDHLGRLGEDYYFPGAHDNASGTALVLDLARYYQQNPHRYTTVFLLFTGEEAGLLGSTFFTENPKIPLKKIIQVVNFDLSCGGDEGLMLTNGKSDENQHFSSILEEINNEKKYVQKLNYRNNVPNSDHYPFTTYGVPAIFVYTIGGFYANVHHASDTCNACHLTQYPSIFNLFKDAFSYIKSK